MSFLNNRFLITIIDFMLIIIFFIFINNEKKEKEKEKKEKAFVKFNEIQEKLEKVELDPIILEQDNRLEDLSDFKKGKILKVPLHLKDKIEMIVLKILYEEKSVRSLKILNEVILERAVKEKITVSEKIINMIINQINKDGKIQFTQRDGWKIRI
ncbi:hypothetical protein LCGC14_0627590 [marine sediment metagenome]|uniref:Uncharacterized protein n=1 Tax=marine sediment metagenome TaxID=412755 RepID=A0A0F9TPC4_9ZZZZ